MPIMVPDLSEEQIDVLQSKAEAKCYRACRDQLKDHYLVLYSVAFLSCRERTPVSEGEADFTIFDPDGGLLVIEVKGGGISMDPSAGKWFSTDGTGTKFEIKDPFRQATKEKHAILGQLKSHPKWKQWMDGRILAGHAVIFPDLDDVEPLATPESHPRIIGGRRNLPSLQAWVDQLYRFWSAEQRNVRPLGTNGMEIARQIFCRTINIRPLVSLQLRAEEQVRIRLTVQQAHYLRMLGRRKRAAICGGAGTGKTLLAVQKAQELADCDRRTLLLCYNRPLAEHLRRVVGDQPNLLVMNFHQYCWWQMDRCKTDAGRDVLAESKSNYPQSDEFAIQWPFALALALEHHPDPFDAVVIDE